ncbi:MAG: TauD/TfdA family dioxygenase [Pseudomonadota bacterium]
MNALPGNRLPDSHPAPYDNPVTGPGVWYGPELENSTAWHYRLTDQEADEICAAAGAVRDSGKPLQTLGRDDFPLPNLARTIDKLRGYVVNGRGFVLLRGFPIDGDFDDAAIRYWGLGLHLGCARSQNTRGHLLGHVVDISDRFENKSERGYLTARHLTYHCDSVDMVALLCLRQAKAGGLSTIVSSHTIHNEIQRRRPDLAAALYGAVPRNRRDEIPEGKGPWYELPVFNWYEGRLVINYLRSHIDMSQDLPDAPRISAVLEEALDLVMELANDPALHLSMEFEPGDIQLLHNHQILHSRTQYEDWPEWERRRYLLRLWLAPPDGVALPDAFAERYGSVTPGDRGGVSIPGLQTQVPMAAM